MPTERGNGRNEFEESLFGSLLITMRSLQHCSSRSQNVPKKEVERMKLVELTEDRKEILVVGNIK